MQARTQTKSISAGIGHSLLFSGSGTPATKFAMRVGRACALQDVLDETAGAICPSYNLEDINAVRACGKQLGMKMWHPTAPMPGYPHGLLGYAEKCQHARHLWLPDLEEFFADAAHLSAQRGLAVGGVVHVLTSGGHLPTGYDSVGLGQKFFGEALHLGMLYLPSNKPGLWNNFSLYPAFPGDLGIPLLLMDNRHAVRINHAVPAMFASLASGFRYTSRSHEMPLEVLAQVTQGHNLLTIAEASVQLPMVGLTLLEEMQKILIGHSGRSILEAQLPGKLADLLVALYADENKLLTAPDPPEDDIEFVSLGGMPRPQKGQTRDEAKEELESTVRDLANKKLAKLGRMLPSGMNIIWSSFVTVDPKNRFAEVQGIRLFRVHGKTAREYIDDMVESKKGAAA